MLKENINNIWEQACDKFKLTYGESVFCNWLKPLSFNKFDTGVIYLKAPNKFIKNWVNNNYKSHLNSYLNKIDSNIYGVELEDEIENQEVKNSTSVTENKTEKFETKNLQNDRIKFDSNINKSLTFESFIISDANKIAFNISKDVNKNNFNPVVIYGGVGRGKTHLLNAIANEYSKHKNSEKIVCISSEKFMFMFVKSLRQNSIVDFKDFIRNAEILLIDDIQFLIGKHNITEEFLYSFDAIVQNGGKVIVTCDKNPSLYENLDERVKSRLNSGISVEINSPDTSLKYDILKAKISTQNIEMPEDVISFLAENISGSVRDVEGALNRIIAQSYILNQKIDGKFIAQYFSKNINFSNKKLLTIDKIKEKVCEHFDINVCELDSEKKNRSISKPRQISMYLCKKHTQKSYVEIAKNFGGKDHSTVINAVKSIEKLKNKDDNILKVITDIEKNF